MFEKQIKELRDKWFIVQLHQDIKENRLDSFWYEWDIATISKVGKSVVLSAHWYIQINEVDNWIVYVVWKVDELPFDFNTWTDEDLANMDNEKYYWVNNNWFSVYNVNDPQDDDVYDSMEDFFSEDTFNSF